VEVGVHHSTNPLFDEQFFLKGSPYHRTRSHFPAQRRLGSRRRCSEKTREGRLKTRGVDKRPLRIPGAATVSRLLSHVAQQQRRGAGRFGVRGGLSGGKGRERIHEQHGSQPRSKRVSDRHTRAGSSGESTVIFGFVVVSATRKIIFAGATLKVVQNKITKNDGPPRVRVWSARSCPGRSPRVLACWLGLPSPRC